MGRAVLPDRAPVLDGRDDDAVWRIALPRREFRQFDPGEARPPTFATEARAAYDDRQLPVLARAFDPHPDSLNTLQSRRDVKSTSDPFEIWIDA